MSKLIKTNILNASVSGLAFVEREQPCFNTRFHSHPEYELVYVKRGRGRRVIGACMEKFNDDELILIGSNLPHVWISDNQHDNVDSSSLVLYFEKDIFGDPFYNGPAGRKILNLLQAASSGILIQGDTKCKVLDRLSELCSADELSKVVHLIEILKLLSGSTELKYIASNFPRFTNQNYELDRMNSVYEYLQNHYWQAIKIADMARILHVTPEHFCRLFKQKSRKSFKDYLQSLRVDKACYYLCNSDLTVAEIANRCGYESVPSFIKVFKGKVNVSPARYRTQALHSGPTT